MRRLATVSVLSAFLAVSPHTLAQGPAVVRTVLLQHDTSVPGYTAVLVAVEIPPGGREGRHTHPGTLVARVEQGELTLDYESEPTRTYKTGEVFFVDAGKIHEGINKGTMPVKLLATFIVDKSKPLTTQVP